MNEEQNEVTCTDSHILSDSWALDLLACPGQETAPLPGSSLWCVSPENHQHIVEKNMFVLRVLYLHTTTGPCALLPCEWCPLELCEATAQAAQFLSVSWCCVFLWFLKVFRGRTGTSVLGMFPSPAGVQSPHLLLGL